MITETEARNLRTALFHCDGHTFALAWNDAATDQRPVDYNTGISGYQLKQFDLMQTKPLDFVCKWNAVAARIVEMHFNGE